MFEDSLVESRVSQLSLRKRWTAVASVGLQCTLAGLVIALPMLHPEALSFRVDAPRVLMPLAPKPPVPQMQRIQRMVASSSPSNLVEPPVPRPMVGIQRPDPDVAATDVPSGIPLHFGSGSSGNGSRDSILDGLRSGDGNGSRVIVRSAPTPIGPVRVSDISQGMLMAPIRPVYPAIARAAGVQGTVVVEAVISRTGTIESLHVLSGPAMLQGAAVQAIRAARYRPYRLNGEPTDVQTTISVNFRMGG
jgi:protein TonB